jgi:hypothetical protein
MEFASNLLENLQDHNMEPIGLGNRRERGCRPINQDVGSLSVNTDEREYLHVAVSKDTQ